MSRSKALEVRCQRLEVRCRRGDSGYIINDMRTVGIGIGAVRLGREKAILGAILTAALGVRLAYLYQAVDTPLFDVLLIDSEFYDRRARAIVAGDWLGDQPFFMNPLYPYFLAAIYALLGAEYWWVGVVQAVLGTGSCYLIYALGRKLWRPQIGLLAAGMAAFYQPYVFYDGALLTAAPITFLNLAALYCLAHAQGAARWLWGAGLLLGLSAMARPMVLLFVAGVAGWFVAQWGRRGWRQWGWVVVGCGLVVGVVAWRNYYVGGEWLLTTSSAGMNFYVGNHPEASGIYAQVDFLPSAEPDLERAAFIREAKARTGRALTPAQASRFWLAAGLRFVAENPLAYLALQGRKLYMFWNGVEAQNNLSLYLARDFVPLLRWCVLGWGLVAPLAVAGWAASRRSVLLDLYLASYLAACLLFFTSSEYRLPVVPVVLLYAACWIAHVATWARGGARRRLLRSGLLVALVALPINYRDAGAERLTRKRVDYYNFGTLYQRRGAWAASERMFREALRIDPSFAPAATGLAAVLARREDGRADLKRGLERFGAGEYEAAIAAFSLAAPSPGRHNNLGLCYYRLGQWSDAIEHFHQALALDAGYARAHFNLGLVYAKQGDDQAAADAFAAALELDPNHVQAHYRRGEVLVRSGRPRQAEVHWAFLSARNPDDARLQAKIDSMKQASP